MAALVTQGSSFRLVISSRSMDNGMCKYTAVPIKDVGVEYTLYRACGGGVLSRLLLLFTRSAALFPSYFLLLACFIHSFTFIHLLSSVVSYSFAGVCSQDT